MKKPDIDRGKGLTTMENDEMELRAVTAHEGSQQAPPCPEVIGFRVFLQK